jgi:hypothetical protein
MKPIEHNPRTPTAAIGFVATLCGPLHVGGSGVPKTSSGGGVVFVRWSGRVFRPLWWLRCCVSALVCMVVGFLAFSVAPALAVAPEAPEVRVELITASTASFYGVLNPNAEGVAGTYEFFYKPSKTGACEGGSHTPASPGISFGAQHEELPAEPVSGLQANTEYAVCLLAETSPTEKALSAPVTFTSAPEAPETLSPAKSVTATTAALEGVLNPKAEANAGWYFDYSTEAGCTENALTSPAEPEELVKAKKETKEVTELQPNKNYEFCLVAFNAEGAQSTVGNEVSLTTKPAPPKVDNQSASTSSSEATLEAQVNPNNQETHGYLQYSTSATVNGSGALTSATQLATADLGEGYGDTPVGPETVTGLPAGTTFYYQTVASNTTGTSYGTVQEFTTVPTPSTDPTTAITATTATFNGHLTLDATPTSYSFDYKLGTECSGESSTSSIEAASASVATPVTGLQSGRLYSVCLVTANASGSQVGPPVSFKTLPETYVTDVGSSSATLHAVLDPEGGSTTYSFQYGTSTSYGSESERASAGSGSKPVGVEAHIQGLSAGTIYHFRVVGSVGAQAFAGADATFTTTHAPSTFSLIDGRQWEQVSPPDKHGSLIYATTLEGGVIQAAEGGGAITYVASGPVVADPQGNRSIEDTQLLSKRGTGGWSTEDIATPHSDVGHYPVGELAEYKDFSPDLSLGLVEPRGETPLPPLQEGAERTIYLRNDNDCEATRTEAIPATCYLPLVTAANVEVQGSKLNIPEKEDETGEEPHLHFEGASPDLSHVVFGESDGEPLTRNAVKGEQGLYEWEGGQLALVSVLPGGEPSSTGGELGAINATLVRHAVSNDGSRIIWTQSGKSLYLRDMESEETVQVDAPEMGCGSCGSEGAGPEFQTASSDGSKVFFTEKAPLTVGSSASFSESAADLYVFEVTSGKGEPLAGKLTDLTLDANFAIDGERARVQGNVMGSSEDGSYVYFVADGVLGDAAEHGVSEGSCKNGEDGGTCNLYVEHYNGSEWEAPVFIATLSGDDNPDYDADLPRLTSRVSPNGQWLAFMSDRRLTGYDNTDVSSGEADEEVYLYHAETLPSGTLEPGKLVCASCNPAGERPTGLFDPNFRTEQGVEPLLIDRRGAWIGHWLAASVPGWTPDEVYAALYQSRYLSNNGRLFFDSPDALVPADVNGKENVYEFEPQGLGGCTEGLANAGEVFEPAVGGCVGLISSGTSSQESAFLDAGGMGPGGEEAEEVFFLTASELSPQDEDQAFDVYDAHVCSQASPCISPPSVAVPPACDNEASCKPSPEPQPSIYGLPSTAALGGLGNFPPPVPAAAKPVAKSLTRAQKLAAALKACHKKKGKQRAKCQKAAHKKYGAKTKKASHTPLKRSGR